MTLNDWLAVAPTALSEPTRSHADSEALKPGDVLANGDVLTLTGATVSSGLMWMNHRQCRAAAYYGWSWSGCTGWDETGDRELFAMRRGLPCERH